MEGVVIAVGDVHGAYDAVKSIACVEQDALALLQVGDLVDGAHSC